LCYPIAPNYISDLPALLAVYSGTRNLRRAKSAAISFNKPHIVNLFSRQTLPTDVVDLKIIRKLDENGYMDKVAAAYGLK